MKVATRTVGAPLSSRAVPWASVLVAIIAIQAGQSPALAQVEISDSCATDFGICRVAPDYVGSYCQCYGDPGRIVPPAAVAVPPPPDPNVPFSDACGTPYGVCRVSPGPLGSYCVCFGDPGQRVPPPPPRF